MTINIANWAEITATIICSACVLCKPSVINRWFVWFLWLTLSVELNGKLSGQALQLKYTVYNIFTLIEFFFYSGLFYQITDSLSKKRLIKYLLLPIVFFFGINLLFIEGIEKYNGLTRCLCLLILIVYCLLHFVESLRVTTVLQYKWSIFVIVTGCFVFFAGNLVLSLYFNYLLKSVPKELINLYKTINHNLAIFMYVTFSIGFMVELLDGLRNKKIVK
jgi:hypothetical protein